MSSSNRNCVVAKCVYAERMDLMVKSMYVLLPFWSWNADGQIGPYGHNVMHTQKVGQGGQLENMFHSKKYITLYTTT